VVTVTTAHQCWEQRQRRREDDWLERCVNAAGFVLRPHMHERFAALLAEPFLGPTGIFASCGGSLSLAGFGLVRCAELPLRALRAIDHDLADSSVCEQDPPRLAGARRAPALGA
jgi:hypothetical protein